MTCRKNRKSTYH